jgi:DNA-directed RNA polymerase delta subunit
MSYLKSDNDLSLAEITQLFPIVLKEFVEHSSDSGQRDWSILQHRFGLNNQTIMTLEELGSAFSLTRERIRQCESHIITQIKKLLNGQSVSIKATIDQVKFFVIAGRAWRQFMAQWDAIRDDMLVQELKQHSIPCPQSTIPAVVPFIFECLAAKHKIFKSLANSNFVNSDIIPIWIFSERYDMRQYDLISRLHKVLTQTLIHPSSVLQIASVINGKGVDGNKRYSIEYIEFCLKLCSSIEVLPDDFYQGKLNFLSRVHQAERLIQRAGVPMLVTDLVREINTSIVNPQDRTVNVQNLTNQMIASKKFKSIGKSGYWALKNMDVVTNSILDLMQKSLAQHGKPLSQNDIYAYVKTHRQVSLASIKLYLSIETEIFIKLPNKLWALKSWKLADVIDLNVEVPKFIKKYLQQRVQRVADFDDLRDALATQYGIKKIAASGILNTQNCVEVFNANNKKMVRYIANGRGKKQSGIPRNTLEIQIQTFMRQQLESQPSSSMLLSELVTKVCVHFQCPTATVYAYVSRTDFIQKYKLNSKSVMCQLVG